MSTFISSYHFIISSGVAQEKASEASRPVTLELKEKKGKPLLQGSSPDASQVKASQQQNDVWVVMFIGVVQSSVCFVSPPRACLFVLEGAECLKRLPTKLLMSVYLHSLGPFQLYRFLQDDLRSLGWA